MSTESGFPFPRLLIWTGLLGLLALAMFIGNTFQFTPFRAVGVLEAVSSPFVYSAGWLLGNAWLKRIGIALLIVGIAMWFINIDMT
jgi:hypothetical protein